MVGAVDMDVRQVEVDGRPVRYRVTGAGSPLVLVHGLAGSWRWWSSLLEPLGERRRVYVVDLPRFRRAVGGAELSAWLARWLDAADLERVDLVGHSLGGLVAAEFAALRPGRTRRVVLIAPAGIPCGRSLPTRAVSLVGALNDIRMSFPMVASDALRSGPISLARGAAFVSTHDLRTDLPEVGAPTLLVWGERDRLVPVRVAAEWQRLLPTSRLVRLSCGHVPMLEAPGELARYIIGFLDEELVDDSRDQVGARVVNGVRLAGDDDQPPVR
jgi:pimeloyl-ACP methyl ester carboxylesterase